MRRPLRNAFLLGIVVGLVVAVVRALRGDPAPTAVGSGAASLPRPTPALRAPSSSDRTEDRTAGTTLALDGVTEEEVAEDVVAPVTADPLPDPPPAPATHVAAPVDTDDDDPDDDAPRPPTWVPPIDGECPDGFPIKAKVTSRIFHVPEGAFYARTVPDRCYPTVGAAAADGFRSSKR